MVQEVRRIMLTADELTSAFECYRRITPGFMPNGQVVHCAALDDHSVRVTLKSAEDKTTVKTDYVFRGEDAVKPLIRFCLENNIMLPRQGQKSLYVKDSIASLYVVLTMHVDVSEFVPREEGRPFSPADIMKNVAAP